MILVVSCYELGRQPAGVAKALAALDALAAEPAVAAVPRVGFVDHELVEVMDAARARGCGRVLTKGQFARDLPALLTSLSPAP